MVDGTLDNVAPSPESPIVAGYDCYWLAFGEDGWSGESELLAELDWKLRGEIRKLLAPANKDSLIFYPTMGKISAPYVVVDRRKAFEGAAFLQSCEGLKVKRVCLAYPKNKPAIKKTQLSKASSEVEITMEAAL